MTYLRYSIIIPTRNRPRSLELCLRSVLTQTIPSHQYEVIIVDDASSEPVTQLVEKLSVEYPIHHLQSVRLEHRGGNAVARNQGLKYARGELIFFTDDDCQVTPDWIAQHVAAYKRHPQAVGVSGWYWLEPAVPNDHIYASHERTLLDFTYPLMASAEVVSNTIRTPSGNTANASYRREVFDMGYVFDEFLTYVGNVDWDFKQRLCYEGYSLVYLPMAVRHGRRMQLGSFIKMWWRRGRGEDYRARKYKTTEHFVGQSYSMSLTFLMERWALWKSDPYTKGGSGRLFLIMLLCALVAKWYNRLTGFAPGQSYKAVTTNRYITWHKAGEVFRQERWEIFGYRFPYQNTQVTPFISVIVPTYNRAELLKLLIPRLAEQHYPNEQYEVIVVDDGSADDTRKVINDFVESYPRLKLRYFFQENQGPARARNQGVHLSAGEYVFFIDSDCVPEQNWLRKHIDVYCQYPEVSVVVGGQRYVGSNPTIYDRFRNNAPGNLFPGIYPNRILITNNTATEILPFDTANMSCRRSVYLSVGGLDERFKKPTAEDIEFSYRTQESGHLMALMPHFLRTARSQNGRDYKRMLRVIVEWRVVLLERMLFIPQGISSQLPNLTICIIRLGVFLIKPRWYNWLRFYSSIVQFYYAYSSKILPALRRELASHKHYE